MPPPRTFRLGKTGLARVMGELEAQVMEVMWASQSSQAVQEVCDSLREHNNYKTVMTVLGRLVDKGLLQRVKSGRAYLYEPTTTKDDYLKSVTESVVHSLISDYGEMAVSSFIHAMEDASPETLEMLSQFLRRRQSKLPEAGHGEQS